MTCKVAIIGCGAISELYYAPVLALASKAGVEVVALFDPVLERAAAMKVHFPAASVTDKFEDILTSKADLAIVASPPRFHAEQSISLMENGIAVLCEKPMAATVAEAEAMISVAAKTKNLLAVGLFRRFFPYGQLIYELVREANLGDVQHFEISEGGPFNWPAQSASFFQKSGSQGGVLADLGIHVLDLLIWWFGLPERFEYEDDAMGGLEANCRIKLWFKGGFGGIVRLSRDTSLPNRTFIEFERGWLRSKSASADALEIGLNNIDLSVDGQIMNVASDVSTDMRRRPAFSYHQSFAKQLYNVVAAMRGEEELVVSGEQGLLSLRLIEQCYRDRKLMSMPWLSEPEVKTALALSVS